MGPKTRISVPLVGGLLERLRVGGKKTTVACALMLVMLFMWGRVLLGHRPAAAAAAAPQPAPVTSAPRRAPVAAQPVDLPKVPGRHDTIARDFFRIDERTPFRRSSAGRNTGTEQEVPVITALSAQEVIQQIGQTLKLGAVLLGERPRALINEQSLTVGDKLTVKDGAETFVFEVLQISVDSVQVQCEDVSLTLRLASEVEVVP